MKMTYQLSDISITKNFRAKNYSLAIMNILYFYIKMGIT